MKTKGERGGLGKENWRGGELKREGKIISREGKLKKNDFFK